MQKRWIKINLANNKGLITQKYMGVPLVQKNRGHSSGSQAGSTCLKSSEIHLSICCEPPTKRTACVWHGSTQNQFNAIWWKVWETAKRRETGSRREKDQGSQSQATNPFVLVAIVSKIVSEKSSKHYQQLYVEHKDHTNRRSNASCCADNWKEIRWKRLKTNLWREKDDKEDLKKSEEDLKKFEEDLKKIWRSLRKFEEN